MKKKILVVDDEWSIRELLTFRLAKRGYQVVTAQTIDEFRKKSVSEKPDLIVLDIWLNDSISPEMYDDLLAEGFDSSIPVIFVTAFMDEGTPPRFSPHGGHVALFGKPFNFDELNREIEKLLAEKAEKKDAA